MSRPPLTSRDWFGKISAAAILGFPLTLALTCIFATLCATDDDVFSAQRQLAMWLASPIWCAILGLCFLFGSSARAWGWLALANLLAWALYIATRLVLG